MKTPFYFLISAVLSISDLIIKEIAEKKKPDIIIKNTGFAGSRMKKHPNLVMTVSAVFTSLIALYIAVGDAGDRSVSLKKLGWSIVLGGALSNSIDRVRKHYVVDYIPIGKYVYNISDFFIYIGALIAGIGEMLA